jgi:hypothetical protein
MRGLERVVEHRWERSPPVRLRGGPEEPEERAALTAPCNQTFLMHDILSAQKTKGG